MYISYLTDKSIKMKKFYVSLLLGIGMMCSYSSTQAQILKNIGKKIEKKVERAVDKTISHESKTSDKDSKNNKQQSVTGPFKNIPAMSYDFKAGSKILFFDDFSEENPGAMASKWTSNGNGEIAVAEGFDGQWLKLYHKNTYKIKELVRIPENFTLEFDLLTLADNKDGIRINFGFEHQKGVSKYNPLANQNPINFEASYRFDEFRITSKEVHPDKRSEIKSDMSYFVNDVMKVKIRVQADRMSAYIGEYKILDTEMVDPLTKKYFYIGVENKNNLGDIYLGNVKITEL